MSSYQNNSPSSRAAVDEDRPTVVTEGSRAERSSHNEGHGRHAKGPPVVEEHRIKPAKTSTAAVFALILGLTALYAVLTVLLSPIGLVLSIVGLVLGIIGFRATRTMGVTGKGVAITGIVLSVVALVGSLIIAAGVTFFLNDEDAVQRLENGVEDLRDDLPQDVELTP